MIDDEPAFGRALSRALRVHGISVESFTEVPDFLKAARRRDHGALLIDWNLRTCEGTELCTTLRDEGDTRPIAIVSGKLEADHARELARAAGADGYIEKPSPAAVVAKKLNELTSAKKGAHRAALYACTLGQNIAASIELRRGQIVVHQYVIDVRPIEYQVFEYLIEHPGVVVSRQTLSNRIWGNVRQSTVVQTAISRLRKQLGNLSGLIETVPGGYRFQGTVVKK